MFCGNSTLSGCGEWCHVVALGEREPDSFKEFGGRGLLGHIAHSSGIKCSLDVSRVEMLCLKDQLRRGQHFVETACCLNAVELGHGDVQQDEIRLQLFRLPKESTAVHHDADDLEAAL